MKTAAICAGVVAASVTWWFVSSARVSVWRAIPIASVALGLVGLALGDVALSGSSELAATGRAAERTLGFGLVAGSVVGVVLYLATRAFVWVASRVEPFRRHTEERYREAATIGLATAIALSAATVIGEELFWRGLVQPTLSSGLADRTGSPAVAAAAATWGLFVAVNLWSRSLPLVAAALVGGLVWCLLPLVTGGILASVVCHLGWTLLMLAFPPRAGRGMMQP